MYAGEVATDTGLGLAILALYASLLEKAITMEFMVHSKTFGPSGMFFFLGGITFVGAVFIIIFIKETHGKEDGEKKLLYTPIEYWTEEEMKKYGKDKDDMFGDITQNKKIELSVTKKTNSMK